MGEPPVKRIRKFKNVKAMGYYLTGRGDIVRAYNIYPRNWGENCVLCVLEELRAVVWYTTKGRLHFGESHPEDFVRYLGKTLPPEYE